MKPIPTGQTIVLLTSKFKLMDKKDAFISFLLLQKTFSQEQEGKRSQ